MGRVTARVPLLVLAACIAAATPALADDAKAKAKQLYDEGLRHYNLGEYTDAIAAWRQAYLVEPKPLLLFNLGQAYRLSGDCAQALTFYDSYLREEKAIKNQDDVDRAVAECKAAKPAEPAQVVAPVPPPPAEPAAATPPPVPTTATPHGDVVATATIRDPHRGHTERIVGLAFGAAGVASGAFGIYFAIHGKQLSNDLNGWNQAWGPAQESEQRAGEAANTRAWLFGGAGVACVVAGAVTYWLGARAATSDVALVPTRGGGAVAWRVAF